jgi:hypothetical protein
MIDELLAHEIEHGTQRSVAVVYFIRMNIPDLAQGDWGPANRAIIDRWSMAGLERVKGLAWGIYRRLAAQQPALPSPPSKPPAW